MRRFVAILCLLLCLLTQAAAAGPGAAEQTAAPEEAAPAEDTQENDAEESVPAGAFSMGAEPSRKVDANAVLLLDLESGETLYERAADERIYPASTTKIMTALCVVNAVEDLDGTEVTVRQEVLDQLPEDTISMAGLVNGERLSVRQLLYCLMLPSGNDAAVVLGDFVGGSLDGFVKIMNETAGALGCEGTHFVSVNGLSGEEHYSTARDMARIAVEVLKDPDLAQIVRTPFYTLKTDVHKEGLELENTNHMLDPKHEYYLPEATGVKTGSSELSGRCIIASVEREGMRLLAVIMGAPYLNDNGVIIEPSPAIVEAHKLFSWVFDTYARVKLCGQSDVMTLTLGGVGEAEVRPAHTMTAVMPLEQSGSVTQTVTAMEGLRAPMKEGETVGQVLYSCGDTVLGTMPLVLNKDLSPIRWWMWPLPVAVVLAILSLVLWPMHKRPKRAVPAAEPKPERERPRKRWGKGRWQEDEDEDLSPFVEYAPHKRARGARKK